MRSALFLNWEGDKPQRRISSSCSFAVHLEKCLFPRSAASSSSISCFVVWPDMFWVGGNFDTNPNIVLKSMVYVFLRGLRVEIVVMEKPTIQKVKKNALTLYLGATSGFKPAAANVQNGWKPWYQPKYSSATNNKWIYDDAFYCTYCISKQWFSKCYYVLFIVNLHKIYKCIEYFHIIIHRSCAIQQELKHLDVRFAAKQIWSYLTNWFTDRNAKINERSWWFFF